MSDYLLTLQARVKALLVASTYFTGVDIITEDIGDIETAISAALQKAGFGLIILSPRGDREGGDERGRPRVRAVETISVVVTCNPAAYSGSLAVLDAVYQVIKAVDAKPNTTGGQGIGNAVFHYTGHEADAAAALEGLHVHAVHFTTTIMLKN